VLAKLVGAGFVKDVALAFIDSEGVLEAMKLVA
jgi:hypothetical protein